LNQNGLANLASDEGAGVADRRAVPSCFCLAGFPTETTLLPLPAASSLLSLTEHRLRTDAIEGAAIVGHLERTALQCEKRFFVYRFRW